MQVVLRVFLGVCVAFSTAFATSAAQTPVALKTALEEMRAYRWDNATELAAKDGQLASDIVEWHRLRAGHGTYEQVTTFLERITIGLDWP